MTPKAQQLLEQVLQLSEEDREELIEELHGRVFGAGGIDSLHPEWRDEIQRRIAAIDSGEAKLIPWEEARKQIFKSCGQRD